MAHFLSESEIPWKLQLSGEMHYRSLRVTTLLSCKVRSLLEQLVQQCFLLFVLCQMFLSSVKLGKPPPVFCFFPSVQLHLLFDSSLYQTISKKLPPSPEVSVSILVSWLRWTRGNRGSVQLCPNTVHLFLYSYVYTYILYSCLLCIKNNAETCLRRLKMNCPADSSKTTLSLSRRFCFQHPPPYS